MIKKVLLFFFIFSFLGLTKTLAEDLKKLGKYKDWEVMVMKEASGKVCFAQSAPVLQAPKKKQERC